MRRSAHQYRFPSNIIEICSILLLNMAEPARETALVKQLKSNYTHVTALLLFSVAALVLTSTNGLPLFQNPLPLIACLAGLVLHNNTTTVTAATTSGDDQEDMENGSNNNSTDLLVIVLVIAHLPTFMSSTGSDDPVMRMLAIAAAVVLCIQYNDLVFKEGIITSTHKLIALGAAILYSGTLEKGLDYQSSTVWGLVIGTCTLYSKSIIKMDILEECRIPLLAVAGFLIIGGPEMLPPSLKEDYHIQAVVLALIVYCGPSFIKVDTPSGNIRYTLLAIAFFFGPSTTALSSLSEPYFRWILLAVAILAAVIASTMNVAGPLRYGYARYKIFYAKLCGMCPTWAHPLLLVLALHPWTSWWLLGMTLAFSWHYVREQHREKVAEITDTADKACIRASSLVSLSQVESVATQEGWKTAQSLASDIARDARAAHHVRLTDFYTESAAAWSKLEEYTRAVGKIAEGAKTLNGVTSSLQEKAEKIAKNTTDYKQERGRILNVAEECTEVFTHVLALQKDGERIRDKVERFRRAADKATKGREMQVKAAEDAVQVMAAIMGDVNSAAVEAGQVTRYADEVRLLAIDAKTAIAVGSEENAVAVLGKMHVALTASEQRCAAVVQARQNVQARMAQFSVAKVLDFVADPDPPGEDSSVEQDDDDEDDIYGGED